MSGHRGGLADRFDQQRSKRSVLTIDSGVIVTIETVAALDPAEVDQSGVVTPSTVPQYARDVHREVKDRGPGPHFLTGPVAIRGAMPSCGLERCCTSSIAPRGARRSALSD